MSSFVIKAASVIGPKGFGNDLTGLRPWPAALEESLRLGKPEEAHWSTLFESDPGRFGRMDLMSRLGLMAIELLEAGLGELPEETRARVGVCVETAAGSIVTDLKFLQTPRASLFSYTLPSTVIGEVCIRYRLRGPVLCLVAGALPATALAEALRWLEDGDAEACACLSCDALDAETVSRLDAPAVWPSPRWEASALLVGRKTGCQREYPIVGESVSANCAELCLRPAAYGPGAIFTP